MKSNYLLAIGAFSGLICVALGAFGAHGLRSVLSNYQLGVYNTGVQYQAWHTLALIVSAALMRTEVSNQAKKGLFISAICFIIGILCFSGSLYALALTGIKWFGPITPFGGLMFMVGWGMMAYSALKIDAR
ncbi:DUF423 domain-containing protein [Vibrio hannami]|uniref:DUF423 domain-containing protein n=1 Tax=Vibrio hannami TaxID=2717094 RepID=UPI00240F94EF|nr:DUF423 domain-containing protein [Vibrio hannami]MDG3088886.1 DUF423 domain-containing protein [Vibrio hannami]